MDIRIEALDGGRGLALEGEMTIYTAAGLKPALLEAVASQPALEIRLAGVSEIDTAGVQLLLLAKREAAAAGTRLDFAGHSRAVLDLIDLYQLAGVLGDPLVLPAAEARA